MKLCFPVISILTLLTASACTAIQKQPSLSVAGDELFADSFTGKTVDTNHWAAVKGTWKIDAETVQGTEVADDHHAAVIRTAVPFDDAVIHFRFKLESCRAISISINEQQGHHSRVLITPNGFSLQKDRNKKDPRSLSIPLGRCNTRFQPGIWYRMTVEYSGNTMLAWIDDRRFAIGTQAGLHTPKANIGFTVSGGSASFDDFSVSKVSSTPGKETTFRQLIAKQKVRADVALDPRTALTERETLLRVRLMQNDPEFNALLDRRIALDEQLHRRWPKAFRPGSAGTAARKKLIAEDAEFKAMNAQWTKARKAEQDYLLKTDPELAAMRTALQSSNI
ncbi:MAG: hypothetical protein AB7E95_06460 [Kiritimatiellales bacterium]